MWPAYVEQCGLKAGHGAGEDKGAREVQQSIAAQSGNDILEGSFKGPETGRLVDHCRHLQGSSIAVSIDLAVRRDCKKQDDVIPPGWAYGSDTAVDRPIGSLRLASGNS